MNPDSPTPVPVLFKPECPCNSPGNLVEIQIQYLCSGGRPESTFLTVSPMMQMLLV